MSRPVPSGQAVDVWWFDTRQVRLGAAELGELSAAERSRAAALAFAADRHRYQAAHVLLRRVLAGYAGVRPGGLRFGRETCPRCGGPSGRPVLTAPAAGCPSFSLSHTGDAVVIAVAGQPVGVDAEQAAGRCVCALAGSMHPADAAAVAGLAEPDRHRAVIRWWVRAEAVLKCAGEGIAHRLGAFPVLAGGHGSSLRELPAPPGCQAALALAAPGEPAVTVAAAFPAGGPPSNLD